MKKLQQFLFVILMMSSYSALAQFPDNQDGRLYRLCKTWGYIKHHHPNKCAINWNDLLLSRVDSVYNASSNAAFNDILYNMCLAAGITTAPMNPVVIMGDTAKNYHIGWFNDLYLSSNVQQYLDSLNAHAIVDTFCGRIDYNDYSDPNYGSFIDFRHDSINNIPNFSYSNLNHRALVYFYYWNSIEYFFPQIDIADHSWDSTLYTFMPDIVQATTDSSFQMALAKVISRIDDSHGFYSSPYLQAFLSNMTVGQGYYTCYLQMARIENKHVIIHSNSSSIHVGDVVKKIDGRDLDSLFSAQSVYMAASNEIAKYRNFYTNMFDGSYNENHTIELLDSNNVTQQSTFVTNTSYNSYYAWLDGLDTNLDFTILDCAGYIHMGKIVSSQVSAAYNFVKNQPLIIFDVRNYPQGTIWDFKPLLFPSPTVSANYFIPDLSYPGYYYTANDIDNFGTWSNSNPYNGKIIILVKEETQSHAEYTAQILRTFPNAITIGSQTAGADGNIAFVDLPGNLRTYWSSLGWYQANWYNPQRAGVQVDTVVHPTIAGVRHGIDEVLQRAIQCPTGVNDVSQESFAIGTDKEFIYLSVPNNQSYSTCLYDMLGRPASSTISWKGKCQIPIQQLTSGIYIIRVGDEKGKVFATKVVKN
jgi:carboxyl-terminal processing protease